MILETRSIKRLYGRFDGNLVSSPRAGIVAAWLRLIYREISPVLPGGIQRGRRPDMRARAPNNLICRDRAERNFMLSRACGAHPLLLSHPLFACDQTSFRHFCPSVFHSLSRSSPYLPLPSSVLVQIWKYARVFLRSLRLRKPTSPRFVLKFRGYFYAIRIVRLI